MALVLSWGLAQWIVWIAQLVTAAARRAEDPGSNPGQGENFSLKLLIYDLPTSHSES